MIINGSIEKIRKNLGCAYIKDENNDIYYIISDDPTIHYPLEYNCIHVLKIKSFINPSKHTIGEINGELKLIVINGQLLDVYDLIDNDKHDDVRLEFPSWSLHNKSVSKRCFNLSFSFGCEFTNSTPVSVCLIHEYTAIGNLIGQIIYYSNKEHNVTSRYDTIENSAITSLHFNSLYSVLTILYENGSVVLILLQEKICLPISTIKPYFNSPVNSYSIHKKTLTYVFAHEDMTISVHTLSLGLETSDMSFKQLYSNIKLPINTAILSLSIDNDCIFNIF